MAVTHSIRQTQKVYIIIQFNATRDVLGSGEDQVSQKQTAEARSKNYKDWDLSGKR